MLGRIGAWGEKWRVRWSNLKLPAALLWDVLIGALFGGAFGLVLMIIASVIRFFKTDAGPVSLTDVAVISAGGIVLMIYFRVSYEIGLRRNASWFYRTLQSIRLGWLWPTKEPPTEEEEKLLTQTGPLRGAAVGVLTGIIWMIYGAFKYGLVDSWQGAASLAFGAGLLGLIGAGIGWWIAAARLGHYARIRFLIAAPLMFFAAAFGMTALLMVARLPEYDSPTSRALGGILRAACGDISQGWIRGRAVVISGLAGVAVLVAWRLKRAGSAHRRPHRSLGPRIGAFVSGLFYVGGAALLVAFNIYWRKWFGAEYQPIGIPIGGIDLTTWITEGTRWGAYAVAVVAAFIGWREWRIAFGRDHGPVSPGMPDARYLDEEEARRAARKG